MRTQRTQEKILPTVIDGKYSAKDVTMGKAESKDGQVLYAVNDFFVGVENHTSAKYHLNYRNRIENQSSSGIIISTGFGMTGWHKSVMAEFKGMAMALAWERSGNRNTTGAAEILPSR